MTKDDENHYYDASEYCWVSENERCFKKKANQLANALIIIATIVIAGGGFLWMLVMGLSEF